MALALAVLLISEGSAGAAQAPVGLGTAQSFAVLAGSTVTNTGPSVIDGDLGVSPGTAVTGFPPGTVTGTIHSADALAAQAQADTTTAYNDAAGRSQTATITADLGGQTLVAGVYRGGALGLTGTLTLDAQGDQSAVFIFQAASTLITASSSRVALINGAQACNVFWQIGSSATLGTNSTFVGTILALTSVTADTGANAAGRLLARNGAVTLDSNTITRATCAAPKPSASPSPTRTSTATPTPTATPGRTPPAVATPTPRPTLTTTGPTPAAPRASTSPAAASGGSNRSPHSGGTGRGDTPPTGRVTGSTPPTGRVTGSIPFTGIPAKTLLETGLAAVAFGGMLLLISRRRTGNTAGDPRS